MFSMQYLVWTKGNHESVHILPHANHSFLKTNKQTKILPFRLMSKFWSRQVCITGDVHQAFSYLKRYLAGSQELEISGS